MSNKIFTNATWIIGCRVVQAILNIMISMMTARYFGPSNYGLINYAASVVAFFVPIMQLGFRSTLVREFISRPNEEGDVLGTSIVMNVFSAIFCMIGVSSFALITNRNEPETVVVCILYSTVLLFQATEMIQYWYQSKLLSKYTSIISLCAYFVISLYKVFLMVSGKSIYWFALSNAFDYLLISVGLFLVYKKISRSPLKFSFRIARELLSQSKFYIVSSMMVTVFGHVGSVILEMFCDKEAVGFYTAAITCAGMTGFVFNAVIDSAIPVILSYRQTNASMFQKSVERLYSAVFYASFVQCIVIFFGAPLIIHILYGSSYRSAIEPLQILTWYTVFSYLGPVRNIWILAEQKQQYLWIINLSGALFSILTNILLVPFMGVVGAAIAALLTQIFTNVIMGWFVKPLRENNKIMFKGLNPKNIYDLLMLVKKHHKMRD